MDKQDDEEYLNELINDLQYRHNENYNRNYVPENLMMMNSALYNGNTNILPCMNKRV